MDTGEYETARTTIKALAKLYGDERIEKMKRPRQESSRLKVAVAKFGEYNLSAVTSAMLSKWRDELGKTLSPQTVHHLWELLAGSTGLRSKTREFPCRLATL